jgi:hypothetical protein
MFSIASQPSRFGQLADYSLNEYIDLPKLTITEYDGHVQLKFAWERTILALKQ